MHWCHSDVWHSAGQQFFFLSFSLCTFCRAEYASYARSTLFHVGFTQEAEWEVQPWRGEHFFKPLSDAWKHCSWCQMKIQDLVSCSRCQNDKQSEINKKQIRCCQYRQAIYREREREGEKKRENGHMKSIKIFANRFRST